MQRLLLVVNPNAGRAAIKSQLLKVIDTFVRAKYEVTCYTTQGLGDPAAIIASVGAKYDRIVCCGGDGTVNEGLNGLMTLEKRPPLGIIPVGVTNDYAYNLAIPSNAVKAATVAACDNLFAIDVGQFNQSRYFTYVSAFGLFTDVTYQTDQSLKNAIGGLAYFLEGVKRVSAIQAYHMCITYDDGVIEGEYLVGLVSNSISVAGLRTAYKDALLDDGLLEIALIKPPTSVGDIQEIIDVLLNTKSAADVESDFLTILRTKKVTFTCDKPVAWTVDGESAGTYTETEIEVHKQAIRVVVGRDMAHNSVQEQDGANREKVHVNDRLL